MDGETVTGFIFLGSKITMDGDWAMKLKNTCSLEKKAMINLDSILKSRDITLLTKVCLVKALIFFRNHVWMWELDHTEGRVPNNWCFQTVVLDETLETPLECKDIKPVNPKGNQSWISLEWLMLKWSSNTLVTWCKELNSFLMRVNEESEKVGLKFSIQKPKIVASSPITSSQIHGKTVDTVEDFIFGGYKITADGDCSHEIKRCLLLGRKVMTNLNSILKSRDITLPTKVHLVKAMVFLVVMYGCESWTVKKA